MKLKLNVVSSDDNALNSQARFHRKRRMPRTRGACAVCGDTADGIYFGALVCLPCKSFFIRCTKDGQPTFHCPAASSCDIQNSNRMRCQACRFNKCIAVGMARREKPEHIELEEGQEICRVCSDVANGLHFGVMTCEGCKKFFRRALKEYETYTCKRSGVCRLNPRSRNACRYCRHQKCVQVGMSREAIRMGRPKKNKKGTSETEDEDDIQDLFDIGGLTGFSDTYNQQATYPGTYPWGSTDYVQMGDSEAMQLPNTSSEPWSSPMSGGSECQSPMSTISTVSFCSNCNSTLSSGQNSPSLNPFSTSAPPLPPAVEDEFFEQLTGSCEEIPGTGNVFYRGPSNVPFQTLSTLSPAVATDPCALNSPQIPYSNIPSIQEVSTITNSEVVETLIQLATVEPAPTAAAACSTTPDTSGTFPFVEDEAVESLLKALEDYERDDILMDGVTTDDSLMYPHYLPVH